MESVEFVQKCSKPNSTEVSYIEATPNPEFFRFSSEIQLSDLNAISFDEQVDIIADEDKIGILNVSIKVVNEIINFNNRKYRRYIKVCLRINLILDLRPLLYDIKLKRNGSTDNCIREIVYLKI